MTGLKASVLKNTFGVLDIFYEFTENIVLYVGKNNCVLSDNIRHNMIIDDPGFA